MPQSPPTKICGFPPFVSKYTYGQRLGKQRRRSAGPIQREPKDVIGARPQNRRATSSRARYPAIATLAHPHRQRSQHRYSPQSPQVPGSCPGPPRQENRRPLLARSSSYSSLSPLRIAREFRLTLGYSRSPLNSCETAGHSFFRLRWHCYSVARLRPKQKPRKTYANGPHHGLLARMRQCAMQACSISARSEEHTSELQSPCNLVCRLLLEKKK